MASTMKAVLMRRLAAFLRRIAARISPNVEEPAPAVDTDGPPKEWLERVRRDAPQLLRRPENGGVPIQVASRVPPAVRAAVSRPVASPPVRVESRAVPPTPRAPVRISPVRAAAKPEPVKQQKAIPRAARIAPATETVRAPSPAKPKPAESAKRTAPVRPVVTEIGRVTARSQQPAARVEVKTEIRTVEVPGPERVVAARDPWPRAEEAPPISPVRKSDAPPPPDVPRRHAPAEPPVTQTTAKAKPPRMPDTPEVRQPWPELPEELPPVISESEDLLRRLKRSRRLASEQSGEASWSA